MLKTITLTKFRAEGVNAKGSMLGTVIVDSFKDRHTVSIAHHGTGWIELESTDDGIDNTEAYGLITILKARHKLGTKDLSDIKVEYMHKAEIGNQLVVGYQVGKIYYSPEGKLLRHVNDITFQTKEHYKENEQYGIF